MGTELSRRPAQDCLTAASYYEAGGESAQGQRAVAQVVLNRVRHPAFPASVCGVVYQGSERHTGCQFSFTCDGSVARIPSQRAWERACAVAAAALAGVVEPSVGMATHYHTTWVVPYWAGSLTKLTTIGAHIFYRWPGYWGKRAAFTGRYRGEDLLAASPIAAGPPQPVVATDFLSAAVAALSRLRADEHAGEMGRAASAGTSKASRVAALSADQVAGELLVDEKQAVLRNGPAPPPEEPGTAVSGN